MSYQNVMPGTAWQPESAARYNAVNRLLDSPPALPRLGGGAGVARENRLLVRNSSKLILNAFDPVRIEGLNEGCSGLDLMIFDAAAMNRDAVFWGILCESIAPGKCGTAVVSGPTVARVYGEVPTAGAPVVQISDNGRLEFATGGTIPVAGVYASQTDGTSLATILLGGGGNAGVDAVTARNNTDEDIPEGTAVMITAYGSIFSCRRALSTFYPWGVALQTIPVGGTGSVQISGTYPGASVGFDGTIVPSLRYVNPDGNTITFDRPVLNVGAVTPVPPYFGVRPVNFDGTTLTVNVSRGYYSINGGEVRGVEEKNITISFDASVDASRVLVLQIKRPETVPTDPSKYGWGAEIAVVNGISTNNMKNYIFRQLARVEVSGRITQPGMVSDCVDFFYVPRFTVFEEN